MKPFNPDRLVSLFGDDRASAREVLSIAVRSLAALSGRLAACEDEATSSQLAHQLKGAAGAVGADELVEAAQELETQLATGWTPDALALAQSLPAIARRFRDASTAVYEETQLD
jgi:HPt (histidine-containing phosphotransfer) domain-containing protein